MVAAVGSIAASHASSVAPSAVMRRMIVALLALILAPLGLLGALGLVVLGLKIAAIVGKASEPPTVDESGDDHLAQGKDVGQSESSAPVTL